MTNNIETMIAEVDKVDDELFNLEQTIADKANTLRAKRSELNSELKELIATRAMEQLRDKDYGCGTANIDLARHKVKVTVSKKVKWNEEILRDVANQIKEGGQDPEDYIKYKLSVSETSYKGFGDNIQKVFEQARTVEPSAPVIKIERK
tara:strand:+ start:507 stop:953 length:447 start_codon:yes stop_codon:yes gene_type:complete